MSSDAGGPRRVVITGLGAITPLGETVSAFWERSLAGESAVDTITALDPSAFSARIAAEVKGFDAEKYMERSEAKRLSRFLQFTIAAGDNALADSGLKLDAVDKERVGCMIGSGIGGLDVLGEQHRRQIDGGPGRVLAVSGALHDSRYGERLHVDTPRVQRPQLVRGHSLQHGRERYWRRHAHHPPRRS